MASYNELLALIDAYINQNGVQAITGQVLNGVLRAMVDQLGRGYSIMGAADPTTDPGTPDGPETWFASVPGTYTNFDGIQIVDGELALLSYVPSTGFSKNTIYEGFQTVQATIDGNVGTPAVGVSYANGILSFDFHNMKGVTGDPAGFGAVTASVDSNIGTPSVQVQTSGPDTAKAIAFQFHNLKGETGVTSVLATVDNTSGNPQCAVSLNGQQLVLNFTGLKGAQGDTGSSVDYPFTIVNNLTTNDATQALSAAMGVQLEAEVSQLEAKVDGYFELNTVDFDDYEKVYFYVANNAKWTSSTTNYGVFVPVTPGQRIFITQGTRSAYWTPVKSTAHTAGTTPDFATGYSARVQVTGDAVVTLPNDAKYLFIDVNISSGLVNDVYQTEDWVDGHEDRIDDLESLTETQGDEIETLDERTSRIGYIDKTAQMVNQYYINTNVSAGQTVDVSSPTSNAEYSYIIIPVTEGQKAKVKGSGGTNSRLWAFTDSSYKLIDKSNAGVQTTTYIELTAPADGYLICNASRTSVSYPRGVQEGVIVTIDTDVASLETRVSAIETKDGVQDTKIADIDDELFSIDSQEWKYSEMKEVKASTTANFLTYLGKCECTFKIESSDDNYIELRATNKATNNSITLFSAQNNKASFPVEMANPRPDLELINVRLVGYSITTTADFTLTITKASPIAPLIEAAYFDKYRTDMPIENYISENKFTVDDYAEMNTSEIISAYDALVSTYPSYVTKTELGEVESVAVGTIPAETNTMYRYDFAPTFVSGASGAKIAKVMLLSGTHPEYMAIRALLKIMTSICSSWQNSKALEMLRFNVHFIVIPVASPWAVNHRSRVNANGVDMARNYPAGWTQGEYVAPPSSTSTYGGTEALSETEAQLVNGVFESEKANIIAAIDFHNHFSTSSLFWLARNLGDAFMTSIAGHFLKLIPRQLVKYNFITPTTEMGTTDATNPGGSFGRNAQANGIEGLTFETSGVVVSGMDFSNLGEVLTVSHDGFVNFLLVLLRGLLQRQYSVKI